MCKVTKWSEPEIIQEDLGLQSGITMMHYNNNNAKGYYWLIPME